MKKWNVIVISIIFSAVNNFGMQLELHVEGITQQREYKRRKKIKEIDNSISISLDSEKNLPIIHTVVEKDALEDRLSEKELLEKNLLKKCLLSEWRISTHPLFEKDIVPSDPYKVKRCKRRKIKLDSFREQYYFELFTSASTFGLTGNINDALKKNPTILHMYEKVSFAALVKSVEFEQIDCLKILLRNKANPNGLSNRENTPLFFVKNSACTEILLEYGANIHHENDSQENPLFAIIREDSNSIKDRINIIKIFIKAGIDINKQNMEGDTPLHCAVLCKNKEIAKFLLFSGAIADKKNNKNLTPYETIVDYTNGLATVFNEFWSDRLFMKEENCNDNIMEMLKNNGCYLKELLALDCEGYCSSDIDKVGVLLKKKLLSLWDFLESDYSPYDASVIKIAKFLACRPELRKELLQNLQNRNFYQVEYLLDTYPYLLHTHKKEIDDINEEFVNQFIKISSDSADYGIFKKLLLRGVDFFRKEGNNSLLCSLIKNAQDDLKYRCILQCGVRVNARDERGKTALSYAILLNDMKKIMILLSYGAVIHRDMLVENNILFQIIYDRQQCVVCEKHPDDLSNIPCINKHVDSFISNEEKNIQMGKFICKKCYEKQVEKCPVCKRTLDAYGM